MGKPFFIYQICSVETWFSRITFRKKIVPVNVFIMIEGVCYTDRKFEPNFHHNYLRKFMNVSNKISLGCTRPPINLQYILCVILTLENPLLNLLNGIEALIMGAESLN